MLGLIKAAHKVFPVCVDLKSVKYFQKQETRLHRARASALIAEKKLKKKTVKRSWFSDNSQMCACFLHARIHELAMPCFSDISS